ncbi:hypothetical protein KAH94_00120 [bacterium]|nr:hypothetical protein [bacterium]
MKKTVYFLGIFLFLFSFLTFAQNSKLVYFVDSSFPCINLKEGGLWGELHDAFDRIGYTMKWVGSVRNVKNPHAIICHKLTVRDLEYLQEYPKEKRILVLWEGPVVRPNDYKKEYLNIFSKIYTWNDSFIDNEKYFKFNYTRPYFSVAPHDFSFEQKKLCTMINYNKNSKHHLSLYGQRREVIEFFENQYQDDFDLYGRGWKSCGYENYKGSVDSKTECIKQYRFCFTYENARDISGYITEKLFDVMVAGSVPVYWGANNITDYVPKNCFIDRRDFEDNDQLYQYLKTMNEQEYQEYTGNIKKYLASSQALLFSWDFHIDCFLRCVEPNYNRVVALTKKQLENVEKIHQYLEQN